MQHTCIHAHEHPCTHQMHAMHTAVCARDTHAWTLSHYICMCAHTSCMHANLWPLRQPQHPCLITIVAHGTTFIAQGQICACFQWNPDYHGRRQTSQGGGRGTHFIDWRSGIVVPLYLPNASRSLPDALLHAHTGTHRDKLDQSTLMADSQQTA